ncbi:MAG: VWA domain-containing protein, partial [Gammaproteobacteria bacterium]|nr:VWA domain-containing protein [Gammaproteobacteria bacterium]
SMRFQDMELGGELVSRVGVVKHVAGDFIRRREGDRIGLVLFGTRAYLQTPLTFDRDTVSTLLNEAELGIAGKRTAIGDAIGLAVKRLRESKDSERVVVLLTDGANTTGEIEPLRAADLAARAGLTVYTIGVGAEQLTVKDFFGSRRINPSSDLDEETLQGIADKTGGRYFRARDTESLEEIYKILDRLEPVASDDKNLRPIRELFTWPLAIALLLTGVIVVFGSKSSTLNNSVVSA